MTFWGSIDTRVTGVETEVLVDRVAVGAKEGRAREFRAGRACARTAIGTVRTGAVDLIAVGTSGAPVWPTGIIGSISHSAGRAAAAVSADPEVLALGIDIERAQIFEAELATFVCREDDDIAAAGAFGSSVAFGAKESVFKAWSPLTGEWLEFSEIRVRLSRDGSFDVLVTTGALTGDARWCGRWQIDDGIVRTAAVLSGPRER